MQKAPTRDKPRTALRPSLRKNTAPESKFESGPATWKQPDESRVSLTSFIIQKPQPADEVFMAAAEKFASWAAREEVNDEHPVKYLTGLSDQEDFDRLTKSQQKNAINLAFRIRL